MRPAVFLDRDDTLIANAEIASRMPHPGYLYDPAFVELLPGVAEGCAHLCRAGFPLVVVTNQSAVARGWCDVPAIDSTNARVAKLMESAGARPTAIYSCLYSPDGHVAPYNRDHPTRKPRGGLLLQAAQDHSLNLTESWMIGDAERDIEAGLDAGLALDRTIIIGDRPAPRAGHRFRSFLAAADFIRSRVR